MKLKHSPLVLLAIVVAFAACKGNKEEQTPAETGTTAFEESLGSNDTIKVEELVDRFFGYALEGEYAEAAAMLYRTENRAEGDAEQVPVELDNEEMAEVKAMLESIPMVGYEIEHIKFSEYYSNEVLCKVVISEAQGDIPAITTKMYFKPVSYLGNWVLCLTNSAYGDQGLIKGNTESLPPR